MALLLAIESSCDETGAAVMHNGRLLSNVIARQDVHQKYGGVIPELASRAHQQNIVPVVHEALAEAGVTTTQLEAIAYTQGPGLLGALLVGSSFAQGLAMTLGVPLVGVNHMQAHILAHFIEEPRPKFPFLCLTVSGGHTQLVHVHSALHMEVFGETQDDAVGEAFDKAAKMLKLPYPGGPLVDKYAQQGNPKAFPFPIPEMPGFAFSFSGIKTAFLYFLKEKSPQFIQENMADICASFQHTLVQMLMKKLKKAVKETGLTQVAIAGGVAANTGLRAALTEAAAKHNWEVFIPRFDYCTDNAAMIAMAGHYLLEAGETVNLSHGATARLHL